MADQHQYYLVLGIAGTVVGIAFCWVTRRITPQTPYADMTALRERSVANPAEIFHDKRAWLYLLCCEAFPKRTASASSVIVLAVSLASLLSPMVLGQLIERLGYTIPLWGLIACLPLSAAVLLTVRTPAEG